MFKRFLTIGVLCMGLLAILGTEVQAFSIAGWSFQTYKSVLCSSMLRGAGNPEINPKSTKCILDIEEIEVLCMNNGGGTGGVGTPFDITATVSGDDPVEPGDVVGRGQAESKVIIDDCTLYDLVKDLDVCQNENWSIIPPAGYGDPECQNPDPDAVDGTFEILKTYVTIIAYDGDVPEYYVTGYCTLNRNDPENIRYMCEEISRDRL